MISFNALKSSRTLYIATTQVKFYMKKKQRAVDSIAVGRNSTANTHRHRNVMKCRIAAFLL